MISSSVTRRSCSTLLASLLALGCASERDGTDTKPAKTASEPQASATRATPESSEIRTTVKAPAPSQSTAPRCREQTAQDFLLRKGQIAKIGASASERQAIQAARQRSIDYRTRQYGRFPGVGSPSDNPHPPRYYAERTTFMGHKLVLHRKVVPALACVEAALERDCASHPYRPRK